MTKDEKNEMKKYYKARKIYTDALVLTEGRTRRIELEIEAAPVYHSGIKRISSNVVKRISEPKLFIPGEIFAVRIAA